MEKAEIRAEMIKRRRELSEEYIKSASAQVLTNVKRLLPVSKNVFLYISMPGEVDTSAFFEEYKNVAVPKCFGSGRMKAIKDFTRLETTAFGTTEPVDGVATEDIYAAIVPGLAFSEKMDRIGFGAGYYDRFLAEYKGIQKIGVCFDFQVRNDFVCSRHDIKMNYIITEKRIIKGAFQ